MAPGAAEAVLATHRGFVAAGADVVLTGTFGGNRRRLAATGLPDDLAMLNSAGARLARQATAAVSRRVVVAGSLGPVDDPRAVKPEDIATLWAEQGRALAAGGVDLLWFETLSSRAEIRAVAEAAGRVGLPYIVTASFPQRGTDLGGLDPAMVAEACAALDPLPLAIGANCGAGPAEVLGALDGLARAGLPLVGKASAGLPSVRAGALAYPVATAAMAAFARAARDRGAAVIGGCCGVDAAAIAAMREALDQEPGSAGQV